VRTRHIDRRRLEHLEIAIPPDPAAARVEAIESLAFESLTLEETRVFADVNFGDEQRHVYSDGIFPDWIQDIRRKAHRTLPAVKRKLATLRRAYARCKTPEAARLLFLVHHPGTVNWPEPVHSCLETIGRWRP
jgi:hypothetical protein